MSMEDYSKKTKNKSEELPWIKNINDKQFYLKLSKKFIFEYYKKELQ